MRRPSTMLLGFAGCALLAFIAVTFNEQVAARNGVRKAWSGIDVQLQRPMIWFRNSPPP